MEPLTGNQRKKNRIIPTGDPNIGFTQQILKIILINICPNIQKVMKNTKIHREFHSELESIKLIFKNLDILSIQNEEL